jgi:hypothetical protein
MTIHMKCNHECPKCQTLYIPYDEDIPCPKCGGVEKERFNFVALASRSALDNLEWQGRYIPAAWAYNSDGDYVLYMIFIMLELHRKNGDGSGFVSIAREFIDNSEGPEWIWKDKEYDREFIFKLACRVYEEMHKIKEQAPV